MKPLTMEEMQSPRRASELLAWVDRRLNEVASEPQGKSIIRFRRGLAKQLLEEIYPLGLFAFHHYKESPDVEITPILGSQSFDARIIDRRKIKSPIEYIEVTQSHEGENEHLRMLELERSGHVNVLGRVTKMGTKATGIKVHVENEARRHSDILAEETNRIECAIKNKRGKRYPPLTALVIAIDDYIPVRSQEDKEVVSKLISKYLPELRTFRWIAAVGWSKRIYLEFDNIFYAS